MTGLASAEEAASPNHPWAPRMAVIAVLCQNITVGCVWGSFSVLLSASESRLGIDRTLSSLAVPIIALATAIFAPIFGMLVERLSLRWLQFAASALSCLGFVLLAVTTSYPIYLVTFGLLLGPGMAAGVVLSPALVTRWYLVNRGRMLGIVYAPILMVVMPVVTSRTLETYGLTGAYFMLAGLSAVGIVASLFIRDWPPSAEQADPGFGQTAVAEADRPIATSRLLGAPRFWGLMFANAVAIMGSLLLSSQIIPLARDWGVSEQVAPLLLSVSSMAGIAGTVFFGWLADRIGGTRALAITVLVPAIIFPLLLLKFPFAAILLLVGLVGLASGGAIGVVNFSVSEAFGQQGFSRAAGLLSMASMPFSLLWIPLVAVMYTRTGSYVTATFVQAFLLAAAGLVLALFFSRRMPKGYERAPVPMS